MALLRHRLSLEDTLQEEDLMPDQCEPIGAQMARAMSSRTPCALTLLGSRISHTDLSTLVGSIWV